MTTTDIKTNQDVVEALGLKAPAKDADRTYFAGNYISADGLWEKEVEQGGILSGWQPREYLESDSAALALLDCFLSRHPDLITRLTGPMVSDESGDTERNCYRCIIYRNGGGSFLAMPCASRPTAITLAVVEAHREMK